MLDAGASPSSTPLDDVLSFAFAAGSTGLPQTKRPTDKACPDNAIVLSLAFAFVTRA